LKCNEEIYSFNKKHSAQRAEDSLRQCIEYLIVLVNSVLETLQQRIHQHLQRTAKNMCNNQLTPITHRHVTMTNSQSKICACRNHNTYIHSFCTWM